MNRNIRKKIKSRVRMRLKQVQIYSAFSLVVLLFGYFVFLLSSNYFHPPEAQATVAKYYSIADGEWSQNIWSDVSSTGSSCSCAPTCNLSTPALIKNKVTVSACGSFAISSVTVDIQGGKLYINAGFKLQGGGVINVAAGDSLLINGKTELSGTSVINVNGVLVINGDLKLSGGSSVCGSGQGYVINGSINGSGWCFTGTLPIELVSFAAKPDHENHVKFNWETATEINNDYFEIERSKDGENFESIGRIKGSGNSSVNIDYSWTDENPFNGTVYYRLRQTDFDGKSTVSKTEFVKISSRKVEAKIYPNPAKINSPIFIESSSTSLPRSIKLYNLSGSLIFEKTFDPSEEKSLEVDLDERVSSGIYIYSYFEDNTMILQGKLMVQ